MADTTRFWNLLAKRYSRQDIGNPAAYEEKLLRTRKLMALEARILELGCGTGGTARLHAPHVAHIRAVDFSDKMIAIAQSRQRAEGIENVTFEVASIDGVASDQRYDMVMAMSVLHLLTNWRDAIAKAYDLLEPGGHFVTSTVVMEKGPWLMRVALAVLRPVGLLPTMQFIGVNALRAEMQNAGFEVIDEWRPNPDASVFMVGRKPA